MVVLTSVSFLLTWIAFLVSTFSVSGMNIQHLQKIQQLKNDNILGTGLPTLVLDSGPTVVSGSFAPLKSPNKFLSKMAAIESSMGSLRSRLEFCLSNPKSKRGEDCSKLLSNAEKAVNKHIADKKQKEIEELARRMDACLKRFQSTSICNQNGPFFIWAKKLARDIMHGKISE